MAAILKAPSEVELIAGLMAAGGIALVLSGLRSGTGDGGDGGDGGGDHGGSDIFGTISPVSGNESMGQVSSSGLSAGRIPLQIGQKLALQTPIVGYAGPGRNTYTYARILQQMGVGAGQWVTVYGSGVAGVHIGPAASVFNFPLVSPTEVQDPLYPPGSLVLEQYPGPPATSISGAPPELGAGTLILEIYQRATTADGDGFASPTENGRLPIRRSIFRDLILFT